MIALAEAGFAGRSQSARGRAKRAGWWVAGGAEGLARPREARGWQGGLAGAKCEANPPRVPMIALAEAGFAGRSQSAGALPSNWEMTR